jgi:NO-binding membrane sensor protein with MHYT domain
MRADVQMLYHPDLVALSVLVAMVAATVALAVGLRFSAELSSRRGQVLSAAAAMVIGVAVAGMHYTDMAATVFVDAPSKNTVQGIALDTPLMAFGITATVVIIFAISLLIAGIDERLSGKHRMGLLVLLMSVIAVGVGGIALAVM